MGTLENDQWAIDDHSSLANSNGGSASPWHVRGGLPCEESHSASWVHSIPWGLWRMTNGPLMITVPLRIPMEGPRVRGTSGGGCHVKRATPSLEGTAFPGDCGERPMGRWWSRHWREFKWRVRLRPTAVQTSLSKFVIESDCFLFTPVLEICVLLTFGSYFSYSWF